MWLLLVSVSIPFLVSLEIARTTTGGEWAQSPASPGSGQGLDALLRVLPVSAEPTSTDISGESQTDQKIGLADPHDTLDELRDFTASQQPGTHTETATIPSSGSAQFLPTHAGSLPPLSRLLLPSFKENDSVTSSFGESGRTSGARMESTTVGAMRPKAGRTGAAVDRTGEQMTESDVESANNGGVLLPPPGTIYEEKEGGSMRSALGEAGEPIWDVARLPPGKNSESRFADSAHASLKVSLDTAASPAASSQVPSRRQKGHPVYPVSSSLRRGQAAELDTGKLAGDTSIREPLLALSSGQDNKQRYLSVSGEETGAVAEPRQAKEVGLGSGSSPTEENQSSPKPSDSSGFPLLSGTRRSQSTTLPGANGGSATSSQSPSSEESPLRRPIDASSGFPRDEHSVMEWLMTGTPFGSYLSSPSSKERRSSVASLDGEGSEIWPDSPDEEEDPVKLSVGPNAVDEEEEEMNEGGEEEEETWPEGDDQEDEPASGQAPSFQALMKRLYRPYCRRFAADPRWQRQFGILVLSAVEWPLYTHKKYWNQPAIGKFFGTLEQLTDDKNDDLLTGPNFRYATQIRSCGFDAILRQQLAGLRKTVNNLDEFVALVRAQKTVDVKLQEMLAYLPEHKLAIVLTRPTLGNLYQAVSQLQILYYYHAAFKREEATKVWQWMFRSERRVHWSVLQLLGISNQVVTPKPMHGIIILQIDKVESREKAVLELFDFVENKATQQALLKFESTVTSAITMRIRKVAKDFRHVLSFGWLSASSDATLGLPDCIVTAFYLNPGGAEESPRVPPKRVRAAKRAGTRPRLKNPEGHERTNASAVLAGANDQTVSEPAYADESGDPKPRRGRIVSGSGDTVVAEGVLSVSSSPSVTTDTPLAPSNAALPDRIRSLSSVPDTSKLHPIEIGQFGFEMDASVAQNLKEKLPPGSMYIQLSLADAWDFQPQSRVDAQANVIPAYSATQILKANLDWDPSLVGVGMAYVVYTTITDPYSSSSSDKAKHQEYDNDRNLIIRVPSSVFRGEQHFLDEVMSMIVVPSLQDSASRTVAPDRLKVMGTARKLSVGDVLKTGMFGVGIPYSQHRVIESMVDTESVCVHLLVRGLKEGTRENSLELPGVAIFDRFIRRSRGKYMLVFVDLVPKQKAASTHTKSQPLRQSGYPGWVLLLSNICVALFFVFVIVCLLLNHHMKLPWWVACICGSRNPFIREPDCASCRPHLGALSSTISTLDPEGTGHFGSQTSFPRGSYFPEAAREASNAAQGEGPDTERSPSRERYGRQTRNDTCLHGHGASRARSPVDEGFGGGGSPVVLEPIQPAGDELCAGHPDYESFRAGDTQSPLEPSSIFHGSPATPINGVDRRERKGNSVVETAQASRARETSNAGDERPYSAGKARGNKTRNSRQSTPTLAVSDGEYMPYTPTVGRESRRSWGRGPTAGYGGDRSCSSRASQGGIEQLKALEIARVYRENRIDAVKSMERRRATKRPTDDSVT